MKNLRGINFWNAFFIFLVVVYSIFPILVTFVYSLLPSGAISRGEFSGWSLSNYFYILSDSRILHYFYNSIVVSILSASITTILGFILAYSVVRKRLPFSGIIENLMLLLNTVLVLGVLIIVPIFEIIVKIGLFNTLVGLVLVYSSLGFVFSFILLSRFIGALNKDYEEAALIEGMNDLQIMFFVVLPMIRSAFFSVWILQFIGFWNEFIFALTLTNDTIKRTLTVGITLISGSDIFEIPWGVIMAGVFISIFPLIVIVSFLEEYLVKGISNR